MSSFNPPSHSSTTSPNDPTIFLQPRSRSSSSQSRSIRSNSSHPSYCYHHQHRRRRHQYYRDHTAQESSDYFQTLSTPQSDPESGWSDSGGVGGKEVRTEMSDRNLIGDIYNWQVKRECQGDDQTSGDAYVQVSLMIGAPAQDTILANQTVICGSPTSIGLNAAQGRSTFTHRW